MTKHPAIVAAVFVATTSVPAFAAAQVNGLDLKDPQMRKTIRTEYIRSPQLPDGLAFISTLRLTRSVNANDPSDSESMITSNMGIDAISARKLIALMVTSLEDFEVQFDDRGREIACEYGVPRAVGDDAFSILEYIDDAQVELSEKHFIAFKNELGEDTAARFQQWISKKKLSIEHVTFNHKELANVMGLPNVDGEMSKLCTLLETSTGGTSE